MEFQKSVRAIDAHAGGQAVRILNKPLSHASSAELLERAAGAPPDTLTRLLMVEPRGHQDMNGCVVLDPVHDGSDISAIFVNHELVHAFSGHSLIGLVTALVETGQLSEWTPDRPVTVDTALGTVNAWAKMTGSEVTAVTYESVPAFVYAEDLALTVQETQIHADVVFGGRFYAVADAAALGVTLGKDEIPRLIALEQAIRTQVNHQVEVVHPLYPVVRGVSGVIFVERGETANFVRTVTVSKGLVNRSPGGTSTAAVLALLYRRSEVGVGEQVTNESMVGSQFFGVVTGCTQVGEFTAITLDITGSAFVTGFMQFVVDPTDPLAAGFLLC